MANSHLVLGDVGLGSYQGRPFLLGGRDERNELKRKLDSKHGAARPSPCPFTLS